MDNGPLVMALRSVMSFPSLAESEHSDRVFNEMGENLYLTSHGKRYRMIYANDRWHIRFDSIPEGLLNDYYYSVRTNGTDIRVEKRHHRRSLNEDIHEFNFVDSWHD